MAISGINQKLLIVQEKYKEHFIDGKISNHIGEVASQEGSAINLSFPINPSGLPDYVVQEMKEAFLPPYPKE